MTFGKTSQPKKKKYVHAGCFAGHGQIPFILLEIQQGSEQPGLDAFPFSGVWVEKKNNKKKTINKENLAGNVMDALICQDAPLLSSFLF